MAQLQRLADDNHDYVTRAEMTARPLAGSRHPAAAQRHAIDVRAQHSDVATGGVPADLLNRTERRVWFLFGVNQGDPPATAG
jgi:DNA-binding ferritin-like protein